MKQIDHLGKIIFLTFLIIILAVALIFMQQDFNKRINNLECNLGINQKVCVFKPAIVNPNPLSGWSEECIQNKTIEKHEFIDAINCNLVCNNQESCLNFFVNGRQEMAYITCQSWTLCFERCQGLNQTQPHINFWNETVCVKKMLVKEVNE